MGAELDAAVPGRCSMTRAPGDNLSDAEKESLYRDLRIGLSASYIARKYNISTVTVYAYRGKLKGTHTKDGVEPWRAFKRICLVNECYAQILEGSSFCAKHDPQPPANRARPMAGRA